MEVIYIDALFLLNLLEDYLLCLSTGRICGLVLRRRRYLAAAFLGAVYAAAVYLPGFSFLAAPPLRLAAGLGMGLTAFRTERQPLRCTAVLLAVSAAFGGAIWALSLAAGGSVDGRPIPLSGRMLFAAFALCYFALRLLFRFRARAAERRLVPVALVFLGRECSFTALQDTGNSLADPHSGERVLVACPHALRAALREYTELFNALPPVELLELAAQLPELAGRLRLLPYRALGGSGLLPVFRPERLLIDGQSRSDVLVAVSPRAAGEDFEALL